MAERTTVLVAVEWCTPSAGPEESVWPALATCDVCYATASDDFMAGLAEPRQFYRQHGGVDDGLVVCGLCLDEYYAEPPQ